MLRQWQFSRVGAPLRHSTAETKRTGPTVRSCSRARLRKRAKHRRGTSAAQQDCLLPALTTECETMLAMSRQPAAPGEIDRKQFVGDADVLAALGVSVEELADFDVRALEIRREHPEFEDALQKRLDRIDVGDGPINPRLHLTMHQIVATQLWDDSPPEVWETAVRLLDAGYERHEILHMLGRLVSDQVWGAPHDERPYDRERHVAALRALPGAWEQERITRRSTELHNDARKQARRNARAARRRNRRPS
jgi:hypothetical protein